MPVPKKKTSRSKRGMRRSHDALSQPAFSDCPECGATKAPHMVCPECGYYKNTQVMEVEEG
ncbi:LSU ribosomal protein L32p @ LSU ribosomal protein L32p, zinc-independent [hydrothermal vent metagenome]|uniref:LSU ribosomal protein L32p @ LSU ribosomal protein L32p, zinc-independent n=1 Tax=hydrothermal vent metagenome TaxID=652676 RepID=A0A3B1BRC0_9ZZZZ